VRPLRIGEGNVGWVFSSVKSYWEEDVRDFVLSPGVTYLGGRRANRLSGLDKFCWGRS
jgi:hypothetical protein